MIMVLSSFGCGQPQLSEFANRKTRGAFIAGGFSMQGFGICSIFNRANGGSEVPDGTDLAWRIILTIGAIPAGLTYYWRMMMPETSRYTALVERNVAQAARDMEKVVDISATEEFSTYSPNSPSSYYSLFSKTFIFLWFVVDIVFYSSNLFQSQIYKSYLNDKHNVNAFQEAYEVARIQAIIAICSTIPGYFATMYFIDRIGRVKIQIMGFFLHGNRNSILLLLE